MLCNMNYVIERINVNKKYKLIQNDLINGYDKYDM
jgi:hypothetical protein